MKYLKEFNTENDYIGYRDGDSYLKPNVSISDDHENVFYNFTPPIVYEAVDLGLPSGTKWAAKNVGASKPSDGGLFFQWGDTQGYTTGQIGTGEGQKKFASNWSDYKWYSSEDSEDSDDNVVFTKYTTEGATLELADDAAHVNMGGNWHMPSPEQIQELLNTAYTTNEWTTQDGVNGRLFTSKNNGKSIFIPAAGYASDGSLSLVGDEADVWSSLLDAGDVDYGQGLYFHSDNARLDSSGRNYGFSVRGVLGEIK